MLLARMLAVAASVAAAGRSQPVDPSTLSGKVLLGYQGWFRCPGGGTPGTNWSHWSNGTPSAASLVIDMYPDLREFDADELCTVPGMTIGSKPATFFSSGHSKTVARHFEWMQQYGLDGVLVQRFVTDIPGSRAQGDAVLKNVMAAARRYGRVFAIEYDISGANPETVVSVLQQDWKYLEETLAVTAHPGYLRHDGRPVVSVWGIGLNETRHPPEDPEVALQLIDWFRSEAKVAYMGGTPAYWRTLSNDSLRDERWSSVYAAMDAIQPWTVGRYSNVAGMDRWKTERIEPDLAATAARGQLYMPVIFPGFSWYNLNRTSPQNQIPRNRGEFLWRQAYNARSAGAQALKIAMFDEVNESTAMFKVAAKRADAPDQGYWLTLDADGFTLPSDWYLRLAGEIARGFRAGSNLAAALPSNPGPPWAPADGGLTTVNAASFNASAVAPDSIATMGGKDLPGAAEVEGLAVSLIDSSGAAWAAKVLYVSPSQVNFTTPAATVPGAATLVVTGGGGTVAYGGLTILPVSPGIFTAAANGQGAPAAIARLVRPDGSQSAAAVFSCTAPGQCTATPVDLGGADDVTVLELYVTGLRGRTSLASVSCTIGGLEVPVLYAGPQGQYAGLDQVNVSLPRSLAGKGQTPLLLTVDGASANRVLLSFR